MKFFAMAFLMLVLDGCDGAGNGSESPDPTPTPTPTPAVSESTKLITNHADAIHIPTWDAFDTDEDSLDRDIVTSGTYNSGIHVTSFVTNAGNHTQAFLADLETFAQQTAKTYPLVGVAVTALLDNEKQKDLDYYNGRIAVHFASYLQDSARSGIAAMLDTKYNYAAAVMSQYW